MAIKLYTPKVQPVEEKHKKSKRMVECIQHAKCCLKIQRTGEYLYIQPSHSWCFMIRIYRWNYANNKPTKLDLKMPIFTEILILYNDKNEILL